MRELFVPEKLKVGFNKRNGTLDGSLSYVIYYDEKGKLRKETSWNSWRDTRIAPLDTDNKPQKGFLINKSIDGYRHDFGSVDSKIRIYDPRGFEFEIEVSNLLGIIHQSDILKTEIDVECVFAWSGKDLVLLPTNSEQYKASLKHTEKQSKKISAKELNIGSIYSLKKNSSEQYIYLGKYMVSERYSYGNNNLYIPSSKTKDFVFKSFNNDKFFVLSVAMLAECLQKEPVENIDEYINDFEKSKYNRYAVKIEIDNDFDVKDLKKDYCYGMIEKIGDKEVLSYSRYIRQSNNSFFGNKKRMFFDSILYAEISGTMLKNIRTNYQNELEGAKFSTNRIKGKAYPEFENDAENKLEMFFTHIKNLGVGLIKVSYSDGTTEYLK